MGLSSETVLASKNALLVNFVVGLWDGKFKQSCEPVQTGQFSVSAILETDNPHIKVYRKTNSGLDCVYIGAIKENTLYWCEGINYDMAELIKSIVNDYIGLERAV